jgi:Cdc6-like AAA superfamily ATPase
VQMEDEKSQVNNDDFECMIDSNIAVVKKRETLMTKQQYCELMTQTNGEQREFILEFIHRLCTPASEPIQVYLAGPAGSGKTFTLKLIMETLNRFSQQHCTLRNAYVACASTGKAAVNLHGTRFILHFELRHRVKK